MCVYLLLPMKPGCIIIIQKVSKPKQGEEQDKKDKIGHPVHVKIFSKNAQLKSAMLVLKFVCLILKLR